MQQARLVFDALLILGLSSPKVTWACSVEPGSSRTDQHHQHSKPLFPFGSKGKPSQEETNAADDFLHSIGIGCVNLPMSGSPALGPTI